VNENVLVPRAETEHLVDEAVAFIRGPMRVLDVGTGCGAIACTIAAETNAAVDGTDISSDAIEIAKENARRLRVADRCRFHRGDLINPVARDRFDVIVANLPYVPTSDLPQPPSAAFFEPREALDGGPDGLDLYRRLLLLLPALLNERTLLLLEAAPPTIPALADIVRSALPHVTIAIGRDYAGLARYVKAQAQVTNQCPPN
ncbi:MAG: peptide chain release factor N(5)-glutamine methyltransferase, partial [Candidatus Eremiobacteraeota bacterium]|nr:peptide chain release factor N(5)-glutamine methyltransferase [Candidatus Eremiobacteraeota bacterium]